MRYLSRPISPTRKMILEFVAANPGCKKRQIVEGTGLTGDAVRFTASRAVKDGELVLNGRCYSIGVLIDRTAKRPRYKPSPEKAKEYRDRHYQKHSQVSQTAKIQKQKKVEVKQSKEWKPPVKQEVKIVYPEGLKVTICPSARYEPLVIGRHV